MLALNLPGFVSVCEREGADEQQVKQETFRMGPMVGSLVPVGKNLRPIGLLHILIYFRSHPVPPALPPSPLPSERGLFTRIFGTCGY